MNKFILGLLSFAVALYITGCNDSTVTTTQPVHPLIDDGMNLMNKRAILDGIDQYNTAVKKSDNLLDICTAAGKLKVAYERAKESGEALIWSKVEEVDCKNAGL